MSEAGFAGPDELTKSILDQREKCPEEERVFGDISEGSVAQLIKIAYHGSQIPNEHRYPRLTLLVPARDDNTTPLVPFKPAPLELGTLGRLGPTLASDDVALLIRQQDETLLMQGIAVLQGSLTQMYLGDVSAEPRPRPQGLSIEILGPGDLRAGEDDPFRLRRGVCRQEISFMTTESVWEWCKKAACELFDGWTPESQAWSGKWSIRPSLAVGLVWRAILRKAASLDHGGCFVFVPQLPSVIRPNFQDVSCDVGPALVDCCRVFPPEYKQLPPSPFSFDVSRDRLLRRETLLSLIDAAARLSATDGCVVFNSRLQVQSFGSMIDVRGQTDQKIRCYRGDTLEQVTEDELRSFGARRLSAIQLCSACPDAMAFVISQDGDLRIAVRTPEGVRLFEHVALW
jgi:hypothetical protein